ncbi:uncharacterized protein RSE6_12982 [Rhynchosporium secalis]|uniref:Uncharacterized protein n=1 Tax=Rhynchosporium secalis TaxID=38038 RepID=A0A1E1MRU3_RHYSE|nr:uncharacterized protein RSE6_12982 [Rhynchosporium secalis]
MEIKSSISAASPLQSSVQINQRLGARREVFAEAALIEEHLDPTSGILRESSPQSMVYAYFNEFLSTQATSYKGKIKYYPSMLRDPDITEFRMKRMNKIS